MRVFAIGDMHLEGGTGKTMDRFGEHWRDHDKKIFESWESIGLSDDLLLVCGDSSWAMRISDAMNDLVRIGNMTGQKIILKGNHDYWWSTASKLTKVLDPSLRPLNGNSVVVNRVAIAATRGWVCPNDSHFQEHDRKIYEREVARLRTALSSLEASKGLYDSLVVALHYPPTNSLHEASGFTELIDQYGADVCVYGHLHGDDIKTALTARHGSTEYHVVSADAVNFTPKQVA